MSEGFFKKFIQSKLFVWLASIWGVFLFFPPWKTTPFSASVGHSFLLKDHFAQMIDKRWVLDNYVHNISFSHLKCDIDSSQFLFEGIALLASSLIAIGVYYRNISATAAKNPSKLNKKENE